MSKPIVVITVDLETISSGLDASSLISELTAGISNKMPDYHVFVIPQYDREEHHDVMEFKVFYEKDHQPISNEELKQLISDSIKQEP